MTGHDRKNPLRHSLPLRSPAIGGQLSNNILDQGLNVLSRHNLGNRFDHKSCATESLDLHAQLLQFVPINIQYMLFSRGQLHHVGKKEYLSNNGGVSKLVL